MESLKEFTAFLTAFFWAYIHWFWTLIVGHRRKDVSGSVVLITGAGHGLGRELALAMSRLGGKVALLDINQLNLEGVAKEIESLNGKVAHRVCDITKEKEFSSAISALESELGPVDILINNAGIVNCLPITELTGDKILATFKVNTLAQFTSIRQVLPGMLRRGEGHIVAVASIAGLTGTAYLTDYCSSKFALVGLMDSLKMELEQNPQAKNICLTTICPLTINTGMFKSPKSRFASIFPVCDVQYVAKKTIDAILEKRRLVTIPGYAWTFLILNELMPEKAKAATRKFFNYGVDPHTKSS